MEISVLVNEQHVLLALQFVLVENTLAEHIAPVLPVYIVAVEGHNRVQAVRDHVNVPGGCRLEGFGGGGAQL